MGYSQAPPELISYRAIALDATGTVISGQNIGIKISILNAASIPIYVETHNKTTDIVGAYNLKIGEGTVTTGAFNSINWGLGNTYLKVEINPDPTGSTNYSINVGTTQFLSVPYALYAKNTEKGIDAVINRYHLILNTKPEQNKVVYMKGYSTEGDGGEGTFIFDSISTSPPNLGTIFESNFPEWSNTHTNGKGRWIRQYSGYINVGYFGIQRNGNIVNSIPTSTRIKDMIDYATTNDVSNNLSDMTIFFPNGTYYLDETLILKNHVKILGGPGTMLVPTDDAKYDYMIEMGEGPIVGCEIDNLFLDLTSKEGIGGIHFKGHGKSTGGIWLSTFKNIVIKLVKGNGIFLEGGIPPNYNFPNQFLTFENVTVVRAKDNDEDNANDYDYNSLRITGQQGQLTFINSTFDGNSNGNHNNRGVNIYIGKKDNKNTNGSGSAVISFINCTSQDSEYGVVIERSENITFDNCWFESLHKAIDVRNSNAINILNNRFANAAGHGSLKSGFPANEGVCIISENSFVNINNNYVQVSNPKLENAQNERFIRGEGNNNTLNVRNNSFGDPRQGETHGIMQTVDIDDHYTITTDSKKLVFINDSGTIDRINSTLNAGETIFVRNNSIDHLNITFNPMDPTTGLPAGTNVYLNGRASLTLMPGQGATFIKIDNIVGTEKSTFQLVSVAD